jgi:dTDP-4-dehydrorhamnose reductase
VKFARIEAIPTSEYPTPAARPANSLLDCSRLEERFGFKMMQWTDSLREVLAEI